MGGVGELPRQWRPAYTGEEPSVGILDCGLGTLQLPRTASLAVSLLPLGLPLPEEQSEEMCPREVCALGIL